MQPEQLEQHEEAKKLIAMISNLPDTIETIEDEEKFKEVANLFAQAKGMLKESEEIRKSITKPIDDQKSGVMDWFRARIDNKLNAFIETANTLINAYREEAEAAQRAIQKQANEKAEKERKRLQQLAERAAKRGDHDKANDFADQAAALGPDVPEGGPPKVAGLSKRDNWQFRVIDESKIPREYLCVDEKKLKKYAGAMKRDANVPGVHFFNKPTNAVRS